MIFYEKIMIFNDFGKCLGVGLGEGTPGTSKIPKNLETHCVYEKIMNVL